MGETCKLTGAKLREIAALLVRLIRCHEDEARILNELAHRAEKTGDLKFKESLEKEAAEHAAFIAEMTQARDELTSFSFRLPKGGAK